MPIIESTTQVALANLQLQVWPADSLYAQAIQFREQIIQNSRDPEIAHWTPDDALGRFKDELNYTQWAKQGRIIVGLTKDEVLGGICFFGKKNTPCPLPKTTDLTVALRMYEPMRGQKLALPFFRAAHEIIDHYISSESSWLSVRTDNARARHIYEKFGYKAVREVTGISIMTYDREEL